MSHDAFIPDLEAASLVWKGHGSWREFLSINVYGPLALVSMKLFEGP